MRAIKSAQRQWRHGRSLSVSEQPPADLKLELTDGMGQITRSLNQLKLNVQPQQENRQPDLKSLKTLKFSIGVKSDLKDLKDLRSQGIQYDKLNFMEEETTKSDTASAIPQETVDVVTTDAGIDGKLG